MSDFPKYIAIKPSDRGYSPIDDNEELALLLRDGSLEDGDIVYEISKSHIVAVTDPKLTLNLKSFRGEIS